MRWQYQTMTAVLKEKVRGGVGRVTSRDYLQAADIGHPFAAFGFNELAPGATIPEHRHLDEEEFYFITAGRGIAVVDGESFEVGPGDATHCPAGSTHGILNTLVPNQTLGFVSIFFRSKNSS